MYFSIIVPVYNVEKYLYKCINSVLSQTCSDYELILVDDGSTDNSGRICDRYAAVNDRVRVLHQENMGQSDARNKGIGIAKGRYILFLDGDDYWYDTECLARLFKYVNTEHPGVDVVAYGAVSYINDDTMKNQSYKCINRYERDARNKIYSPAEFLIRHLSLNRWYNWAPWIYAFSRRMFCDGELLFPVGRKYEDFYLMWRLLLKADNIGVLPVRFYVYGKYRHGSTTGTAAYKFYNDQLWAIDNNIRDARNMPIDSRLKHSLLSSFSMYYVNACGRTFSLTGKDRNRMLNRIERRRSYLQYADGKQYDLMRICVKIIGFRNTIRLSHFYTVFCKRFNLF